MRPRRLYIEVLESRTVLSTIAGELPTELAAEPSDTKVAFYLQVTDEAGDVRSSFQTGETLLLNVLVEDVREDAQGVFAALLDVLFDNDLVAPAGSPEFGSQFPNMHQASCGADGVLDEIGAIGGLTLSGPGPLLVMQIPFVAVAPGSFTFSADPADDLPHNEVLVYGGEYQVSLHQIEYGSVQIEISGAPLAEVFVPCNSNIPKGPVVSDSELEEINNREKAARPAPPPTEPIPETHDERIVEMVRLDPDKFTLPLSLVGRSLFVAANIGTVDSFRSAFGIRLVDFLPVALDDPSFPVATAGETGQADLTTFAEDVQFQVDLPIGTASVTSTSTAAVSTPSSDLALEELLTDSAILPLLRDDLNASP